MNIASASLLQRSVEDASENILKQRQMQQEAREAAQRNALEMQLRNIQEGRYEAQAGHYAETEAAQAEMAKKAQEANDRMMQQADDKYKLSQHIADLESTSKNLQSSIGDLAQDVVAGKMTPQAASDYVKGSWSKLAPDIQQQIVAQNPKIQAAMDGQIDWATAAKNYQATLAGKGSGGKEAVGIQYQNAAKSAQDALDAGQQPGESDADWQKRSTQLQALVTTNMAAANSAAHLFPTVTRTETGTKTSSIPNTPPSTSTNTVTTSYGAQPDGTQAPPPAAAPAAMPPKGPLPTVLPSATPTPPPPSAGPAPGLPTPANPIPTAAHIAYLQAHPDMAPLFDQKFGQGASTNYLQPQPAAAQ